jgi:hypothetical protein
MKRWYVPITIIEHRRMATVIAESRAEALKKIRAAEWDMEYGLGDAEYYTIKVVGRCMGEEVKE